MSIFAAALFSAATPAIAQVVPLDSTIALNDAIMVQIRVDDRECDEFGCGGYLYREVGERLTVCHDGIARNACQASTLDFSLSRFDDELMWQVVDLALDGVLYLEVITDSVVVLGNHPAEVTRLRIVDVALSQGAVN